MKLVRLGLALGFPLWTSVVAAADVSPEARKMLDETAKAYKALPAYSDQGRVTLTFKEKADAPAKTQVTLAKTAFARPNKLAIDADVVRVVSDGKTLRTIVPPLSNYRDLPAPTKIGLNDLADGPLGAVEYSGPKGRPLLALISFLMADDPVKALVDDAKSIKTTAGDTLVYEPQVGPTLTLKIDPTNKLVTRISVGVITKEAIPNATLTVTDLTWTSGPIDLKPADATFTLVKPDGYAEIAALAKDVAKAKAENSLIGQPAPEFSLYVLDGPNKSKRVSKADLAGKVVLLDFWATWCGPCMVELPDIQKLTADYAKAKKPIVVVAVSIDQSEDGDFDEIRGLIDKTLKSKSLDLQIPPVGLIALDPSSSVARAYGAQAIPQLVLIDEKGVVRHVHIGVTARDVLTEEIDALLERMKTP